MGHSGAIITGINDVNDDPGSAGVDTLTRKERSDVMRRVRAKDTGPERVVRRLVSYLGFRYRLHGKKLPGKPDLVFSSRRSVIFVHGCFWHRHTRCALARIPKSRIAFWREKLEGNRRRDVVKQREIRRMGWKVLVVWECQLKHEQRLLRKLRSFLEGT
jgi:DNA mismatch endonuclease (patch repair protein)